MKKGALFLTNLFMSAVRYVVILILSVILIIVGAIWVDICLYIGLGVLALYLTICVISALRMQRLLNYRTDDDPEFNEMMDRFSQDPKSFLSEIMEAQEENKNLHGEDLLALSDDDLFETVYFQNLDIAESAEDEDKELEQFDGARKTVYVLSMFDSEIQNGGLCQFFVNSSRAVAPFVSECLKTVGADEHCKLFDGFILENNIDVTSLKSFTASSEREYVRQTKRYDFDSFDKKYCELPTLEEKVVAYIRANISEF